MQNVKSSRSTVGFEETVGFEDEGIVLMGDRTLLAAVLLANDGMSDIRCQGYRLVVEGILDM